MKSTDIRKAINRLKRAYHDFRELEKTITHNNGDESMIRAYYSTMRDIEWFGERLAKCMPNGELLYPEFFSTSGPPIPADKLVPPKIDHENSPAWCNHCDNPKTSCTCYSQVRFGSLFRS